MGGCATGLLIIDPGVAAVRRTYDVDVIAEIAPIYLIPPLITLRCIADVQKGTIFPAGTAMSPIATYNLKTGATTLVSDQTALWGASIVYSKTVLASRPAFSPYIFWTSSQTSSNGSGRVRPRVAAGIS